MSVGKAILIAVGLLVAAVIVGRIVRVGAVLAWLMVLGTSIWAGIDAAKIGLNKYRTSLSGPVLVVIGGCLLWIVVFPWYLVVRGAILSGKAQLKDGSVIQAAATTPVADSTTGIAEQLEKLASLREKGILSQAEFDQQKARILGKSA